MSAETIIAEIAAQSRTIGIFPFDLLDVEQRSEEWFVARLGLLTGSQAYAILAQGRAKHEESVMRRNLRIRLALERVTQRWIPDTELSTAAIKAGIEREPLAVAAYESWSGEVVQRAGFLAHRKHAAGCSPDGYLRGFDKLISIKCRQPAAHWDFLKTGTIPADALAQIRHELWITDAMELDYFCWNPEFPDGLQSKCVTVRSDQADLGAYEAAALKFLAEVDAEVEALQTMAARTETL